MNLFCLFNIHKKITEEKIIIETKNYREIHIKIKCKKCGKIFDHYGIKTLSVSVEIISVEDYNDAEN